MTNFIASTAATYASAVAASRKTRQTQSAVEARKPKYFRTAKRCVTEGTLEDIDLPSTQIFYGHGKSLALTDTNCSNSDCSRVSVNEARLLLRALTGDMERTACWRTLNQHGTEDYRWPEFCNFRSLQDIDPQLTQKAKEMVAQLLKPDISNLLNAQTLMPKQRTEILSRTLKSFYEQRADGNAIAHPFFGDVNATNLIKIAKLARGSDHETAWPMLAAWERMRQDITTREGQDALEQYKNPIAKLGEVADLESLELNSVTVSDDELERYKALRLP